MSGAVHSSTVVSSRKFHSCVDVELGAYDEIFIIANAMTRRQRVCANQIPSNQDLERVTRRYPLRLQRLGDLDLQVSALAPPKPL